MTAHEIVGRIQQLLIACRISSVAIPTCCVRPLAKILGGVRGDEPCEGRCHCLIRNCWGQSDGAHGFIESSVYWASPSAAVDSRKNRCAGLIFFLTRMQKKWCPRVSSKDYGHTNSKGAACTVVGRIDQLRAVLSTSSSCGGYRLHYIHRHRQPGYYLSGHCH